MSYRNLFVTGLIMFVCVFSTGCKDKKKSSNDQDSTEYQSDLSNDKIQTGEDSQKAVDGQTDKQTQDTVDTSNRCEGEITENKQIGEECLEHCECATGWCYDEGYMAPFRYCARSCPGGCGEEYQCLLFSPIHWNEYGVKEHTLCMPRCKTVADCKKLSEKYEYCPTDETKWVNTTLAVHPTCQIKNMDE